MRFPSTYLVKHSVPPFETRDDGDGESTVLFYHFLMFDYPPSLGGQNYIYKQHLPDFVPSANQSRVASEHASIANPYP